MQAADEPLAIHAYTCCGDVSYRRAKSFYHGFMIYSGYGLIMPDGLYSRISDHKLVESYATIEDWCWAYTEQWRDWAETGTLKCYEPLGPLKVVKVPPVVALMKKGGLC